MKSAVAVELAVARLPQVLMCGLGSVPLSCPLELAVELAAEPAVAAGLAVVRLKQVLMCVLGLVPLLRPLELVAAGTAVLLVVQQVQLVVERHYKTPGY